MSAYFITGTDTRCGKTWFTSHLLMALKQLGIAAVGMKPIATGAVTIDGRRRNDDAMKLWQASCSGITYADVNPYCLTLPTAPHIAAAADGIEFSMAKIVDAYQNCLSAADIVLVEGIGGWALPLDAHNWLSDLVGALDLRVILVAGIRLGGLNHTLLTARGIDADGADFAGWVANQIDPHYAYAEQTVATLMDALKWPLLIRLAWRPERGAAGAAALAPLAEQIAGGSL